MIRKLTTLSLVAAGLLALTAVPSPVQAESLWKSDSASLFSDQKAKAVGDLITIVIVETTTANQTASTNTSKKESTDIAKGIGPLMSLLPKLGFSANGSTNAQGSTSRSTNISARMSAKIVKVEPNGNMVIEGSRDVGTNNDKQLFKVTGTIRSKDVAPDNTILSSLIADAKIDITGKGPISEKHKPGIISRVLKLLF